MAKQIAYCLFRYFPYGGLQRDFLRIAEEGARRGHMIDVFTMDWQGDIPDFLNIHILPVKGISNHQRVNSYIQLLEQHLEHAEYDCVVGFNKMPGLDVYYAADPCYRSRAVAKNNFLYCLSSRFKAFSSFEQAVFDPDATTQILLISPQEQVKFQQLYHTPDERFHLLPPPLQEDRRPPKAVAHKRAELYAEFNISTDQRLLLFVASAFKTKGLDRIIKALGDLPAAMKNDFHLLVVGGNRSRPYQKAIKQAGLTNNIIFTGARDDIADLMVSTDLLLHPAYTENTGTVLLEALLCGLPVITTANCGYAFHVNTANAGIVVSHPFNQKEFNKAVKNCLHAKDFKQWKRNAIKYTKSLDLFSMPQKANDIIEKLITDQQQSETEPRTLVSDGNLRSEELNR